MAAVERLDRWLVAEVPPRGRDQLGDLLDRLLRRTAADSPPPAKV